MKLNIGSPRSWVASLAMAVLIPFSAPASAGLTNGNFDGSPLTWSLFGDAFLDKSGNARSGANSILFPGSDGNAVGRVSQQVSALAAGSYELELWLQGDINEVYAFYGVAGTGFGTSIGPIEVFAGVQDGLWTSYTATLTLPVDPMLFLSIDGGENFRLDDVSLTLNQTCTGPDCGNKVPEPGSLLLVGAALAGVAVARRRKMV